MPFFRKKNIQPELSTLLMEFNRSLMLIVDKSLLIDNILSKIKKICAVDSIYIFLLDENTGKYKIHNNENSYVYEDKSKLISWLSINEKELIISKNRDIVNYLPPEEQEIVTNLKTELIYPLKVMNHISGMLFLGKKMDHTPFTREEISLLSILFDQAAFAIEHVSLYETQSDRLRRMYRTDRLATLGELAAGAAHEIRNPLTTIRSTIQYLSKDFKDDEMKSEMMTELITEVERINKILQGLLSFARPSQLNITKVNMEELINQILTLTSSSLKKQNIQVDIECDPSLTDMNISGDMEQLKQVFLNIVINAAEAMTSNASGKFRNLTITIEKGAAINAYNRYLLISFKDTGKGIDPEDVDNIFNPFFTTKENGTGLGLAICYGIINQHKGDIQVDSTPDKGTSFTIKLPQQV